MATATVDGRPYPQHRGGAPGFVKVVGPQRLATAEARVAELEARLAEAG